MRSFISYSVNVERTFSGAQGPLQVNTLLWIQSRNTILQQQMVSEEGGGEVSNLGT